MRHAYTTKAGRTLYKPSSSMLNDMDNNSEGWCLVCGETVEGCEPDAERYKCECCNESLVFGPFALALRNLVN